MKLPRLMEGPAWGIWVLYAVALVALMWGAPYERSVAESYFDTADAWWAAERDIYTGGIAGYLYPPQSLYVFTPFTWVPRNVGHALWRIFGLALLALGIKRASLILGADRRGELFALSTLLVLSSSIGAAKTGQSNLHLAGCLLLAGAHLARGRWWQATLWLGLGLFMKPLAMVMILLVGALYWRPMAWRLGAFLVLFLAVPLLHADTGYALQQYDLALDKLVRSSQPGDKSYADLVGLLRTVGIHVEPTIRTLAAVAAAVATLAGCVMALLRRGSALAAMLVVALAATYLMLFNPRTETNSYVILAPHIAFATWWAFVRRHRHVWAGVGVLACLLLGCDNYGRSFHQATAPWLKPLIALLFAGVLVRLVLPNRRAALPAET